jgi:hypothetical protein
MGEFLLFAERVNFLEWLLVIQYIFNAGMELDLTGAE